MEISNDSNSVSSYEDSSSEVELDEEEEVAEKSTFLKGTKIFDTEEANGKIDADFSQGNIGDCALLSSVWSIYQTEEGASAIEDSISIMRNDDGSISGYDVHFKGTDETYNISQEELMDALTYGERYYSHGDDDVTVLELAMEKAFESSKNEELRYLVDSYCAHTTDMLQGVNPSSVSFLLTGSTADIFYNRDNTSPNASFYSNGNYTTKDINGNKVEIKEGQYYKLTQPTVNGEKDRTKVVINDLKTGKSYTVSASNFTNDIGKPDKAKNNQNTKELFQNFDKNKDKEMLVFATTSSTKGSYSLGSKTGSGETKLIDMKTVSGEKVSLYAPHAYAVSDVKDGVVTLVNPHDTSKPIQVKMDDLFGLQTFFAYSIPLK